MVITHSFQDLFEVSSKTAVVSLPAFKETTLKIKFGNTDDCDTVYDAEEPPLPFVNSAVFRASIYDSRRLTALDDGCKNVYEVAFDVKGSNFIFKPGDTIGIIPKNNPSEVDTILSHLDLTSQAEVSYELSIDKTQKGAKIPPHVPVASTLRHVLTHCLDIRSVVKKLFILALSRYTKDENVRKVLEYLCSKEGSSTYNTHILNKNICILDLFAIFKTCRPPIEILLAYLPRLLPRPYSIVNSLMKEPNVLRICFSVMDIGNKRKGLVTGWLEELTSNTSDLEDSINNLSINENNLRTLNCKVPIYLRNNMSGFSAPDNSASNLLLIGPGTGVSPYIGFLQEREFMKHKTPDLNMGETWLLFGCRNPQLDFIYEQELKEFLKNGTLNKLNTAFSRMENCETKYIQDIITNNGEEIAQFIRKGAIIFVCGDLKSMAAHIREALEECLVQHSGKSKEQAKKYISDLQKEKRYLVDQWC